MCPCTLVHRFARLIAPCSIRSVRSRLDSTSGLSFTEFSYQLLQAFDFLTLHQQQGCTIQLGGSDQLGNIMSGVEMIRKANLAAAGSEDAERAVGGEQEEPAYGVTMPLLTTASGDKFGKSAGNAVWLDPGMTSPFDFYQVSLHVRFLAGPRGLSGRPAQFFLRTTDDDVLKYLKIFSFIRVIELHGIIADHKVSCSARGAFPPSTRRHRCIDNSAVCSQSQPNHRVAQKVLASEATELVHGRE